MHGELFSGSTVLDVLSRGRSTRKRCMLIQKEDHEYLRAGGSGHGGREFKKVKELESTHEGSG